MCGCEMMCVYECVLDVSMCTYVCMMHVNVCLVHVCVLCLVHAFVCLVHAMCVWCMCVI